MSAWRPAFLEQTSYFDLYFSYFSFGQTISKLTCEQDAYPDMYNLACTATYL